MTFEELNINRSLLNALDDMHIKEPTSIQRESWPVIMSGRDVVGIAQTGTGKTLAYLLPVLTQLRYSEQRNPRVLIMVPTRELVVQVMGELEKLTSYMNVRCQGVYGGVNINTQKERLYPGMDIIVATPGRLYDLVMTGIVRLRDIQKLVIDEVDEMLSLGFRPQLLSLMELLPPKRQSLMFSATLAEEVEELILDFFHHPQWVDVYFDMNITPDMIDQSAYLVPNFATKFNLLSFILEEYEQFNRVLVFAPDKKTADKLYNKLFHKYPHQLAVIHSNKSQNQRLNALEDFKNSEIRILISTDLVARGVDIFEVSHVINFGLPEIPDLYVHRIGRTGRLDKKGVAISLVSEAEQERKTRIEEHLDMEIPLLDIPGEVEVSESIDVSEETALGGDKAYLKPVKTDSEKGEAFHEKKKKNQKVNLGGPGKKKRDLQKARKKRR